MSSSFINSLGSKKSSFLNKSFIILLVLLADSGRSNFRFHQCLLFQGHWWHWSIKLGSITVSFFRDTDGICLSNSDILIMVQNNSSYLLTQIPLKVSCLRPWGNQILFFKQTLHHFFQFVYLFLLIVYYRFLFLYCIHHWHHKIWIS